MQELWHISRGWESGVGERVNTALFLTGKSSSDPVSELGHGLVLNLFLRYKIGINIIIVCQYDPTYSPCLRGH